MKDFLSKLYFKLRVFAVPIILMAIFVQLLTINNNLSKQVANMFVKAPPYFLANKLIVPILKKTVLGESSFKKNLFSAEAAVVMDGDSKVLIFSKNENLRFSMASTTKIMTALVGLKYFKLNDILTVYEQDIEGVNVGFKKEQKYRFRDVLYAMLLPSGNDAALTIAQNYLDGEEAFVTKMNEAAQSFYLRNTHFSDPIGLTDEGDYTTAYDLARLTSIALKNPTFAQVVSTKHTIISDTLGLEIFSLFNLNKLLDQPGITGVKTGFTEEAKGVLVTSKNESGHTIIIVVMRSKDRFADTNYLLQLVSEGIVYKPIYYPSK